MTSTAKPHPSYSATSFARAAGIVAILIGGTVLVGWLYGLDVLKSILSGLPTMKANTALSFVLIGLSLWLASMPNMRTGLASRVCAAIAGIIGLLALTQDLSGWDLGIDQLLFEDPHGAGQTFAPAVWRQLLLSTFCC